MAKELKSTEDDKCVECGHSTKEHYVDENKFERCGWWQGNSGCDCGFNWGR